MATHYTTLHQYRLNLWLDNDVGYIDTDKVIIKLGQDLDDVDNEG